MVQRVSRKRRDGVAAAELAILLPFLSFAILVALDFCRAYYCSQAVQAAADAAALYASGAALPPPNTTSQAAATQAAIAQGTSLQPPLNASNVNVVVTNGVASVTVTYPFNLLFGGLGNSGQWNLSRTVSMNVAPTPVGGW